MKGLIILILAVVVVLLVVMELGLRSLFGFGNPLIYIRDHQVGYLLAPNQATRRFGNRIEINQYSMRSGSFQEIPTSLRVLVLGDSIANGGWWTDQANTIPSLIMSNFQEVEVLNASANSWSPRNQLAYLEKFGTFNAGVVVLLINTDDLFGTAPTSLPVGRDRNYPDHKPLLAIFEVCQRYIFKQKAIPGLPEEKGDRVGTILTAIDKIYNISQEKNSKFLLVMTPLLRELDQPGSRDYEIVARQRLSDFTKIKGIDYIDFLPIFQATTKPETLYHDHIHLNLQGSQLVSQEIGRSLLLETRKSTQ